jgi:hypothetical protein
MIETPSETTPEIAAALERFAITPRRVVLISPLRDRKGSRLSYRVDAADGRIVKVRQLDSGERARCLLELRAGLEAAFAPALAYHGCVLLEEWIDGAPLSASDAEGRAEEAGALLGRLHACALDVDTPTTLSTSERTSQAISNLEILCNAGQLTPREAAALRAEIARRDPGTTGTVLIHLDFCAENMLIDARGHLRVIDNELLTIAPAGFDLGRTFDRWPMSNPAWARFCRGYRSSAPAEPEAVGFWKILAALLGARVRYERSPARLDASLALLRRFAAGNGLADA